MSSYKKYVIHYFGLSVPIFALLIYLGLFYGEENLLPRILRTTTALAMAGAVLFMMASFTASRCCVETMNIQGDSAALAAMLSVELELQEHRKMTEKVDMVRTYERVSGNSLLQRYERWLTGPVSIAVYPGCVVLCGPRNILQRMKAAVEELYND